VYQPKVNIETRTEVLHHIMVEHPFVTLITPGAAGTDVNHVPLVLDAAAGPHGTLRGHVARANPLWKDLRAGEESIAVFKAADYYVSPSWYPTKRADPRVVPTWNYVVVHAHGVLKVIEDAAWLRAQIEALTNQHEAGRPGRWHVSDAPVEYLELMQRNIVGIELVITRLEGKVKASQNRSAEDRAGVVRGLIMEDREAASAMSRWVPLDGSPPV